MWLVEKCNITYNNIILRSVILYFHKYLNKDLHLQDENSQIYMEEETQAISKASS